MRHVEKQTTQQRSVKLRPMQPKDRLPRHNRPEGQNQAQQRDNQNGPNDSVQRVAPNLHSGSHVFTPKLQLTGRRPQKQHFHQPLGLSGSNPRRLNQLISLKTLLLKPTKQPCVRYIKAVRPDGFRKELNNRCSR